LKIYSKIFTSEGLGLIPQKPFRSLIMSKEENYEQMHFTEILFICPMCGKEHSMFLEEEDANNYFKYRKEKLIQDIFPDMSKTDREKFITGYCDECQKKIFGTEEN
jgi:hypothetical protein